MWAINTERYSEHHTWSFTITLSPGSTTSVTSRKTSTITGTSSPSLWPIMGSYDAAATQNQYPKVRATLHQTIVSTRRFPNAVAGVESSLYIRHSHRAARYMPALEEYGLGPRAHRARRIRHVLDGGHRKSRSASPSKETNLVSVVRHPRSLARVRGEHCRVWEISVMSAPRGVMFEQACGWMLTHTGSMVQGKIVLASEK